MNINQVKELLQYRATKSGYNGNISPNDFNLIWPQAEQRYFNVLWENYLRTQKFSSGLTPFKSDPTTITIDANGKCNKNGTFLQVDSIRHNYNGSQVEVQRFEDDRLGNKLQSTYDAPSLEFPIYVEYDTYFQFYPINLGNAVLVQLNKLVPSVWGYDIVSGRPVYNASKSTQPKWKDTEINEIIYIVGSDLGINMRDQQFDAFSERKIQTQV